MAKFVLRNCRVEVNAVDFSAWVSSVEVSLSKDDVETSNFGGNGRERVAGLRNEKFTVNFQQDFSTSAVDSVLWPLYNAETEFTVKIRPTSGAKAVDNPEYLATCILLEYQPLSGKIGDLSDTSVTFPVQRNTLTRATS